MRKSLVLMASLFLSATVSAAPASAHSELVSMVPAIDSTVTSAPTSVVLIFNEKISTSGFGITVTGPEGLRVDTGAATVSATHLSIKLGPLSLNGHYIVNYRVVSKDGHPTEKSAGFDVLIASLTASTKPSIEVPDRNGTGIERGEGLARNGDDLSLGIIAITTIIGGLLFYLLRRRLRATGRSANL